MNKQKQINISEHNVRISMETNKRAISENNIRISMETKKMVLFILHQRLTM